MTTGDLAGWLALAASLAALGIAVVALRKVGPLGFRPDVLAGDVILPRMEKPGDAQRLLLPLHFTNAGNGDGVIEWLALRLTHDDDAAGAVVLGPVAEVDMQRFLQAGKRVTSQNALDPFTSFPLEGKRAVARFVLFDVAERNRLGPLRLKPGRYGFELFVKATHARQPRLERSFEHVLEPKHLEDLAADTSVYLINYHVTLPSVRRAIADCEWLPRASPAQTAAR